MRKVPALIALTLAACASFTPYAYVTQPARIADPHTEVITFIKQNTTSGCIVEPGFTGATLEVKWVCQGGLGHAIARLDRVASISVEQAGEWYRVTVHHSPGIDDFMWTSKSLEDIERVADAFDALSGARDAAKPKSAAEM